MNETIASSIDKFNNFSFIDYLVFVITLLISTAIGIYFGFVKKSKTTDEYLMGGRTMKIVPIAISIIASQISAVSILGLPAEMYSFGTQYLVYTPFILVVVVVTNYAFIPVFFNNQLTNCYEYLAIRFNIPARNLLTATFILSTLFQLPIVMFVPALAFSQATGVNVFILNSIISAVCILYTMLGGIKAVVWTDVFQATVMLGSCVLVSIYATQNIGGFFNTWAIADKGNRIEFFNMKLDLTTRHTFWNATLGYSTIWLTHLSLNQSVVQRLLSVPSIQHARKVMYIVFVGYFILINIGGYIGIAMYSKYADCDPLKAGIVQKPDQMVPYFVQDIIGHLMGMSGLFMSCVLSAALSTISANINSLSPVFYYDVVRKMNCFHNTDSNAKLAIKMLIVMFGIYSTLMGYIVAKFQFALQLMTTVAGITHGTIVGIFLLAALWPYANIKGVLTGAIINTAVMGWIILGTQIRLLSGITRQVSLPTSIEDCDQLGINVTHLLSLSSNTTRSVVIEEMSSFSIYDIAFPWYSFMGAVITVTVGVIVSFLTGGPNPDQLHSRLYPPMIHWMLPVDVQNQEIKMSPIISTRRSTKPQKMTNVEFRKSLLS